MGSGDVGKRRHRIVPEQEKRRSYLKCGTVSPETGHDWFLSATVTVTVFPE